MRDTMAESGNAPHLPAKEQGNRFCKLQHCGARANARLYHGGSPECARRFQSVPGGVTMQYTAAYQSSVGDVLLAADETGLTGLWFEGEKFYALSLDPEHEERETPIFAITRRWLDIYFSGHEPDFMPPVHMIGSEFRRCVWELLLRIPYGTTVTYGDLARQVARRRGLRRMSAQAVGGAVGHNEISIIVPCHRVVGTNGSLTGYAGGVDKKRRLLELEGVDMEKFFVPARGTAL
ncbi:methylated-DNA--[protein]-cysteine S-methyltransferase [Desulfovibrio sp. 6_1_46AFAA]|uniref:methylated-DNA--[protein]-cysteine S-methyltransferase n=1 Tax=Desulfovibrio sp. 6_1_46AFAA TaxID=665942 RepID=UPI001E3B19D5|nr:methylated-DNA--[protein]-cysteine S-methyltransferase [Desulfovibrio sp. 6_1_46AFAA]